MRIALLGTRGVPANYGGFETFADQLGQRLAQSGHQVTVYCRSPQIRYPGTHDTACIQVITSAARRTSRFGGSNRVWELCRGQ